MPGKNGLLEPSYYILLSLAEGDKHGYAILKTVGGMSEGRVRLSTGTLYSALSRLLDQDLIVQLNHDYQGTGSTTNQASEKITPVHPGKPRRTYALTHLGRLALQEETNRLKTMLKAARVRLEESA